MLIFSYVKSNWQQGGAGFLSTYALLWLWHPPGLESTIGFSISGFRLPGNDSYHSHSMGQNSSKAISLLQGKVEMWPGFVARDMWIWIEWGTNLSPFHCPEMPLAVDSENTRDGVDIADIGWCSWNNRLFFSPDFKLSKILEYWTSIKCKIYCHIFSIQQLLRSYSAEIGIIGLAF